MKPRQVDWRKLVITEKLFCYREIEFINKSATLEKISYPDSRFILFPLYSCTHNGNVIKY